MGLLHDCGTRRGFGRCRRRDRGRRPHGYDSSNIAGALLFMTEDFGLSTGQQQLVTTAPCRWRGARRVMRGALWPTASAEEFDARGRRDVRRLLTVVRARMVSTVADGGALPAGPDHRCLGGCRARGFGRIGRPEVRGALLVLYQVATVTGIIAGYLVAWALSGTESWRWMVWPPSPER